MTDRFDWTSLSPVEARKRAADILFLGASHPLQGIEITAQKAALPFYEDVWLYHFTFEARGTSLPLFLLRRGEETWPLSGTSEPFHDLGREGHLNLTPEVAEEYLRFYCLAVRGDEGPFQIVGPEDVPEETGQADGSREEAYADLVRPVELEGTDDEGRLLYAATVYYDEHLFLCRFSVAEDGTVLMLEDEILASGIRRGTFGKIPPLHRLPLIIMRLVHLGAGTLPAAGILQAMVEILLEEALGAASSSRVLGHFNRQAPGESPLDRFALFVSETSPVVALESRLPFVEETVTEIVKHRADKQNLRVVRPSIVTGDDTQLTFDTSFPEGRGIVLLPFHAYRGILDVERVAHELATHDPGCLIGCARTEDIPSSIREVVDLTLRLPRLSPRLFSALFERVMDEPLPEGALGDAHWTTHVHHSDFQHPQGLELSPEETLDLVRERAEARLTEIEPTSGLRLDQLHGLGEARRFAEDLITDIHEAIEGHLKWDQVDRGVLLIGEPGTGKTTLARAIAKECGIRFISASAAGWQAVGHLGDHIRALRSDFTRARQNAPAILFIDEIDSIGSREDFSGKNAQYSTQVVNALLEQIQGMDPEAPVIVIGATNYAGKVDPALRRSGRLDRTIEIPRPNVKALADIFRHYLEEYAGGTQEEEFQEGRIDVETLGGLAFGLTGADVERIVRGALRRARRAGRTLRQSDLIDEVTKKPRDGSPTTRLTEDEIRRVAIHEAGHALAATLSDTRGADISFISIVPRADGTLGFVARRPDEQALVTREEYLQRLGVMLGGRAAEELVFGKEHVTGGGSQDLRVATQSAAQMITQMGLGPEGNLLWSETPSSEQREEVNRFLRNAYDSVLQKLRAREEDLTALADLLEEEQELTGEEMQNLFADGNAPLRISARSTTNAK